MRFLGEQQASAQKQVESGGRLGTTQLTATLLNTSDCFLMLWLLLVLLLLLPLPPGRHFGLLDFTRGLLCSA